MRASNVIQRHPFCPLEQWIHYYCPEGEKQMRHHFIEEDRVRLVEAHPDGGIR
jgi:hypothetical protein